MNTLIGLLIIAIGSFGQSSSYVPINKVKNWSWESFWLVQGIFAWLVFPLLGALLAIPAGSSLLELWGAGGALHEAEELMKLCEPGVIDKTRYLVRSGEHIFEVDEFYYV